MERGRRVVSSEKVWKGARQLWDSAHLLCQKEISRGNCECIAVRADRKGRKQSGEVLTV